MCSRTICSRLRRIAALTGIGNLLLIGVRGDQPRSLLLLRARVLAREQELRAAKQRDHAPIVLAAHLCIPYLCARAAVNQPGPAAQGALTCAGEEVRLQLDCREAAGVLGER